VDTPPTEAENAQSSTEQLDLFISHRSEDRIANSLFALIRDEVYGGDTVETGRRVFFSSDGKSGLRGGDNFGRMLEKLEAAKRVVAVITLQSRYSTAVQTEMALADHQKKLLPVVARRAYRDLLKWPFERYQAPALDSPDDIRQLLAQLAEISGRPIQIERTIHRCARLAKDARRSCPDPARRKLWRIPIALGALLLAALIGYRTSHGPETYAIGKTAQFIDGTPIKLVHQDTFPEKLLSTRLHEIWRSLGDQAESADSHRLFMAALRDTNRIWGLRSEELSELERIVTRWQGGDSKIASGKGKACDELEVALDKEWCAAVQRMLRTNIDLFDDTAFAVVSLDDPPHLEVLTVGNHVPTKPTSWKVEDIGGATIRIGD
jgi:hypothetical protein